MKLRMLLCTAVLLSLPIASHAEPRPVHELDQVVATHVAEPLATFPGIAFTQTTAQAPASSPSIISAAFGFISAHLGGLVGLLGLLLSTPFVASHLDAKRKRELALCVYHCYHIAADADEELAPGGAKSTAEKIKAVLAQADDFMRDQGWRPLKPGESGAAASLVKSLAGQAKVAEPTPAAANPQ